jgi:hypothetical protein
MTRGKGKNPITGLERSMTTAELDDIRGMKQEAEATLKHVETHNVSGAGEMVDKGKLKAEIAKYDAIIHEGSPKQVRGMSKDRMIAEAKQLEESMQKNMPSRFEMDHPERNPGAVQKHLKWEKRNAVNIPRYKEIMRTLEPDDPTATNIDRLRNEK